MTRIAFNWSALDRATVDRVQRYHPNKSIDFYNQHKALLVGVDVKNQCDVLEFGTEKEAMIFILKYA